MKKTAAAGERHRQPGRLSERLSKKILMDTGIHTDPGTFSRTYAKGHGRIFVGDKRERRTHHGWELQQEGSIACQH